MDFLPENLRRYTESHTEDEPNGLHQINRETHLHVLRPRMLSGHLQGRVLAMLSHMIKPTHLLEIGTYTGYATLCMAEGMTPKGRIITIDRNEELAPICRAYFDRSPFKSQIEMKVGDALDIIPQLEMQWDLVFIDADKENYEAYYELTLDKLARGGYIIADNVLWSGKVAEPAEKDDTTEAIRAFNRKVHNDPRVQNVLFPIRDGLMILRKL